MLTLPGTIMAVVGPFAQAFTDRTWPWVQVLVVGTIVAPGRRTVAAVLRVVGLSQERQFQLYHRVLNRASWSGLVVSRILLGLVVAAFLAAGAPLVLAADETLERRSGPKIDAARARRHKTSVDWVGQMVGCVRRWLPERPLVLVVDGGLAAVKLGRRCAGYRVPVTCVSRLRADACLYDPPAARRPGQRGAPAKRGPRQASFADRARDPATDWERSTVAWYGGTTRAVELATGTGRWFNGAGDWLDLRWVLVRDPAGAFAPQAVFATDPQATPSQIVGWFVRRWSLEVTFQDARAHLGVETQRQWSDRAIARTTPALLGLFSLVTLLAHRLLAGQPHPVRTAAWYTKTEATFADTIALVRRHLLTTTLFPTSPRQTGHAEIPAAVLDGLVDAFCYAA